MAENSPEMPGFLDLETVINEFAEIEKHLIDFIESDSTNEFKKFEDLNESLNQIELKTNSYKYSLFLVLVSNFSLARPSNRKINEKIEKILGRMILTYDLKNQIKSELLFSIFKKNKTVLLYLLEEGMIIIEQINQLAFYGENSYYRTMVFFFLPEIKKNHEKLIIQKIMASTKEDLKIFEREMIEKGEFMKNRKNGHSENIIAQMIQRDDIDQFIDLLAYTNYEINSRIKSSYFESSYDINQEYSEENCPTLIEYSMIFGSIEIFKYLFMNEAIITEESMKYLIIGGNYEMIHIIEERTKLKFNEKSIEKTISYHHQEIKEYLETLGEDKTVKIKIEKEIEVAIFSSNFISLRNIIKESRESFVYSIGQPFMIKCFTENPSLIIVKFLLKQPGFNINLIENSDRSSLYYASENGRKDIVSELMKHPNINVNLKGDCYLC